MSKSPILPAPTDDNIREWLMEQTQIIDDEEFTYLLAFADDGVIWGRVDGNTLVIAHEASQKEDKKNYAQLRGKTLQQAHLFGEYAEVRIFRDEMGKWQALLITNEGEVITESQILWGDKRAEKDQPVSPKFTKLLAERKGIPPQILPIEREKYAEGKYVRLEVHHMVDFNEDGEAYIKLSRLAGISFGEKKVEVAK
jgi:CRISPR-associated protein (TIGR03984 family)